MSTTTRFAWIMKEDGRGQTGNREDLAGGKERRGVLNGMKND